MNLILNKSTEKQLQAYLSRPVHALLILGQLGSGKTTLMREIVSQLLDINIERINDSPLVFIPVLNDKGKITIEEIRQINRFLSLRVSSNEKLFQRAILIDNAQLMSPEAQNGLLKNLEEPPNGTLFVLTASNVNELIPTIISRAACLRIIRPSKDQLLDYLIANGADANSANMTINQSGGNIGLATAIIKNKDHPLIKASEVAKDMINATQYDRLVIANKLAKDRILLGDTINMMSQIAQLMLENTASGQASKWERILKVSYNADKYLKAQTNAKLTATYYALNL